MIKYHFEAISPDGKQLSGFLFSESIVAARAKLTKEGNAVLALDPFIEQQKKDKDTIILEFKAHSKEGKEVKGDIEAVTEYVAYKKLRLDYDFDLIYLVRKDLPLEEKELAKNKGIDPMLEVMFDEDETIEERKKKKTKDVQEDIDEMLGKRRQAMLFLQAEIAVMVKDVQKLLDMNGKFIKAPERREIQNRLDRLSRLRQSNSIQHLESMLRRLYNQLSDDTIFITPTGDQDSTEIEVLKEQFRDLAKKQEERLKSKALAVGQLDINGLRSILRARLIQKLFSTIYWMFAFLFIIFLNFWGVNLFKILNGIDVTYMQFYFQSGLLWFLTGISGIITILLAVEILYTKPLKMPVRAILYSTTFIILFLFTLEFPVLFSWTVPVN